MRRQLSLLILATSVLSAESPALKTGHSSHGEVFDEGPREKPWAIEGIGKTHLAITTSSPEVQKWFDQGHTLLHSFWFYEAERSFRWCLKLEPDSAMAYWGLARAAGSAERARPFILEAVKRKAKVSERERMLIEAWDALLQETPKDGDDHANRRKFSTIMEKLCMQYPDEPEFRAMLTLETLWDSNRVANELMLQQILKADPEHPGAHHYRIHNWNGAEDRYALDSAAKFGRIAPGIGHAQHMPGHIYSEVGMWHEAAISMDSATRVEQAYMRRRLIFPFNDWNYAHNRNYLSYVQEQLGMAEAALRGAREILSAPLDPKYNNPEKFGPHWQGSLALMRGLIKFQRWSELADPKTFHWTAVTRDKMYKAYCEAIASIGVKDLDKAAKSFADLTKLDEEIRKEKDGLDKTYDVQYLEVKARLALAKGDTIEGLASLSDAARREAELQETQNDPPFYSNFLYNALGRAYLAANSPALAVTAFEKTLTKIKNDGFALSGLVEAYSQLGNTEKAKQAMGRLLFVWSDADSGLPELERARATGVTAQPTDTSPAPQRNYAKASLETLGPQKWEPYEAPKLDARDEKGKRVTLEEYRGKNVLLIFYLGSECAHCMEQLSQAGKRIDDWNAMDTVVLAISSQAPEKNAARSKKIGELPMRLLSDSAFENAHRFKSYDDFEDMELHSTILIDKQGRVRWGRNGGDPFTDFDFLVAEIKRINGD